MHGSLSFFNLIQAIVCALMWSYKTSYFFAKMAVSNCHAPLILVWLCFTCFFFLDYMLFQATLLLVVIVLCFMQFAKQIHFSFVYVIIP